MPYTVLASESDSLDTGDRVTYVRPASPDDWFNTNTYTPAVVLYADSETRQATILYRANEGQWNEYQYINEVSFEELELRFGKDTQADKDFTQLVKEAATVAAETTTAA